MTSDSSSKRRRSLRCRHRCGRRCRGRTRAALLLLAACVCGALVCGALGLHVVFWWGDMDSVRRYVTARGHVMQEHLETDAHALLDQSLHWCHFAVRPTLFMLSAPGSVFLVFELAACGGGIKLNQRTTLWTLWTEVRFYAGFAQKDDSRTTEDPQCARTAPPVSFSRALEVSAARYAQWDVTN